MKLKSDFAAILFCLAVTCGTAPCDEPTKPKPVTLMGMLSPWLYPDAKFGGATSGDAAVSEISSIKSRAVQTTSDPADKVVDFYLKKLNVNREGRNLDEEGGERVTTDRAISVQDNSAGRPLTLVIITISEKKSATTLVVSRSEHEEQTNIAWSNYRQIWP